MHEKDAIPFNLLIAAAGSGTRLGHDTPKQYMMLGGKTVLRRTLEQFLACPGLQQVRVIIDPAYEELYQDSVMGLDLPPPVAGGSERNISVFNGISDFSNLEYNDIILIHDAARPFISPEDITAVVREAAAHGAATLACPVSDTLKRGNGDYVDRNDLWAIQTPQGFHYGLIREAHEKAAPSSSYTDDTAMVAALGHDIKLVPGPRGNFKITTAADFALAQKLTEGSTMQETRTGTGFDVHKFAEEEGAMTIRLCGVDVPHDRKLAGHSDADVGLHALTDALLGALGAGDIGQHFPPSDPQWQGADSVIFVEKAVDMVVKGGGKIVNVDLTLICESPKVTPHRAAMRARVAQICGIAESRINIKATTTEGLGFTGRREGIAAQALATIMVPHAHNES